MEIYICNIWSKKFFNFSALYPGKTNPVHITLNILGCLIAYQVKDQNTFYEYFRVDVQQRDNAIQDTYRETMVKLLYCIVLFNILCYVMCFISSYEFRGVLLIMSIYISKYSSYYLSS